VREQQSGTKRIEVITYKKLSLGYVEKMDIAAHIKNVPNFPVQGIIFKDITPLFQVPEAFNFVVDSMGDHVKAKKAEAIMAIEARGFIFGSVIAARLNLPFVPARKPGKLPRDSYEAKYALEYGEDALHVHKDAIRPGQKVAIIDDLLATGGTMAAACALVEQLKGQTVALAVVIELKDLNGRQMLPQHDIFSLLSY
jgi:adenine phosphoribosyltransferase